MTKKNGKTVVRVGDLSEGAICRLPGKPKQCLIMTGITGKKIAVCGEKTYGSETKVEIENPKKN